MPGGEREGEDVGFGEIVVIVEEDFPREKSAISVFHFRIGDGRHVTEVSDFVGYLRNVANVIFIFGMIFVGRFGKVTFVGSRPANEDVGRFDV